MMSGSGSISSNWEISLYEMHRKPHEVIIDDSLIAVSPRALHSELMCPICLDLMRNTQTTKECLHRFCQECIITALRSGNKECPTCRKKLVSKRSLRPDPNFDALIAKIYPNRDELQQQERQRPLRPPLHQIQKRKRRAETTPTGGTVSSETPPSSRASTPLATPTASEKRPKLNSTHETADSVAGSDTEEIGSTREEEPKVEFQLRPHPHDDKVSTYIIRNLCSTPETTVAHLVKFLQIIQVDSASSSQPTYSLSAFVEDDKQEDTQQENSDANYVALTKTVSLKEICEKYWIPGEKLKLFFSINIPTAYQE